MIKVSLSRLVNARLGHRESVVLDLDDLTILDLHLAYIKGELDFTRVADGILAEGTLATSVETECARCTEPFYKATSIELEDIISLPGAALTQEKPVRVTEDGWADLSPLIREYAWIELPVNPLCSPECRGLCPECGGNLNKGECKCVQSEPIDPRWEVLRSLLDEDESQG